MRARRELTAMTRGRDRHDGRAASRLPSTSGSPADRAESSQSPRAWRHRHRR
jgi:hypothetical protein